MLLSEKEIQDIIIPRVWIEYTSPTRGCIRGVEGVAHAIHERMLEGVTELKARVDRLEKGLEDISDYVESIPDRQRDDALETVLNIAQESLAVPLLPRETNECADD